MRDWISIRERLLYTVSLLVVLATLIGVAMLIATAWA